RCCHPSPAGDPFHVRLGLRNLASVAAHYREAGAGRLVLVDVVEDREQAADYRAAIPGAEVTVVRLRAPLATILRRLEGRERGSGLEWYRNRARELGEIMDRERIGDVVIETDGKE